MKRAMPDIQRLKTLLGWIDAVPRDAELPTMPGFDRDYVDALIEQAVQAEASAVSEAVEMAEDWIACVPESIKLTLPAIAHPVCEYCGGDGYHAVPRTPGTDCEACKGTGKADRHRKGPL